MGVSHTLSRHFFWNENVLWKKDLVGRKTTVSLGGKDLIVNTEAVGRYLSDQPKSVLANGYSDQDPDLIDVNKTADEDATVRMRGGEIIGDEDLEEEEWKTRPWRGSGIDVFWFEDLDHAQIFDKPSSRRRVISAIRAYCEE